MERVSARSVAGVPGALSEAMDVRRDAILAGRLGRFGRAGSGGVEAAAVDVGMGGGVSALGVSAVIRSVRGWTALFKGEPVATAVASGVPGGAAGGAPPAAPAPAHLLHNHLLIVGG